MRYQKIKKYISPALMILLASTLWACSDDTNPATDTNQTVEDTEEEVQQDTSGETTEPDETTTDTEPDAIEEVEEDVVLPTCFIEDRERLVGDRCYRDTDRVCITNDDCRSTEVCEDATEEELGTCMYQIPEPLDCPGSAGCENNTGPLRAAVAIRTIMPEGYELARPEFTDDEGLFTGDTEDPDTYFDCGRDRVCPDDEGYTEPDADGSEGNEIFDGAWLAGFDHSRPAFLCPEELLGDDCEGPECCVNESGHDDIWARGVMFEQGDSKVAMLSVDLVGFFYSDIQRIVANLPESLELDLLIVSATHTHEAPDGLGQWGPGFIGSDLPEKTGVDSAHMAFIHAQITDLLVEADENLVEADLYAARIDTGTVGLAVNDSRDPWIFDDDLSVLHIVEADGDRNDSEDTIGLLMNWGSHPESMSDENPYISSDFPHYARYYVENGFPELVPEEGETLPAIPGLGGATVYYSGAVGGLIGPLRRAAQSRDGTVYDGTSWEKTDAIGQQLALATFRALETATKVEGDLTFGSHEFLTGIANLQFQTGFMGLNLFDREIYNWRHSDSMQPPVLPLVVTSVARVQIGNVTFATVPGEVFPETLTGGFLEDVSVSDPVRGSPHETVCDDDLMPVAEGDDPGENPCIVSPGNPNPPDLESAPNAGFLRGELPGEIHFVLGLGQDELGYLVPTYDFELMEGAPYVGEPPGDHYEETNSVGPHNLPNVLRQIEILFDLDEDLFRTE